MIDIETTREILKMRGKGASISRISRELNISRPTILRYLKDDESPKNHHHPESGEGQRPFIPKKSIIPVDRPSEELKKEREVTEITELKVEQAKSMKELKEVKGSEEHPRVTQRKAEVELTELSVREYEAVEKLETLKEKGEEKRQIQEAQRRAIGREEKIKAIIQEIKEQVLPFKLRVAIPSFIILTIYQRMETELLKFDILNLSHSEILLIADAVLDEAVNDPSLQPIITDSFREFFLKEAKRFLNLGMRQTWEGCFKRGETTLDYKTFTLSQIQKYPTEKQREIFQLIDI